MLHYGISSQNTSSLIISFSTCIARGIGCGTARCGTKRSDPLGLCTKGTRGPISAWQHPHGSDTGPVAGRQQHSAAGGTRGQCGAGAAAGGGDGAGSRSGTAGLSAILTRPLFWVSIGADSPSSPPSSRLFSKRAAPGLSAFPPSALSFALLAAAEHQHTGKSFVIEVKRCLLEHSTSNRPLVNLLLLLRVTDGFS